jgi:SNF2 family DNA or RNA helicase
MSPSLPPSQTLTPSPSPGGRGEQDSVLGDEASVPPCLRGESSDPSIEDSRPATEGLSLSLPAPGIHITGMNSALQRPPAVTTDSRPLLNTVGFVPSWRPSWGRVRTFGLTFPAGIEMLPVKPELPAADDATDLKPIGPETPEQEETPEAPRKRTKIRPPQDALSVQDRLFFLLQPPLENWLKGQELVMPFEPFQYQYEGIAWLFANKSALLADEMGLGKTMQTITALRLLLRAGQVRRVLLVCPKPLIPNWQREFKTWAEEIPVTTVEGDGHRRNLTWRMPGAHVLLANYEVVVRDYQTMIHEAVKNGHDLRDGLGRRTEVECQTFIDGEPARAGDLAQPEAPCPLPRFDLVVLDEAQRTKNRDSLTAKTIRSIPRGRSVCLTGTPIENRPEEMSSLFEFMGVIPPGANPDLRQLSSLSREFILRRTKDLVMKDMPPRLDRDEIIELSSAQRIAYDAAEKEGIMRLNDMGDEVSIQNVFELVLRLKQISNYDPLTQESSKLERLHADMEEIAASGGKAILFSQWTKTIDWLEERMRPYGCLVYHGGIPQPKREPILTRFKEDPDSHIILMSYATGAVGLNLQFAGYVFLYDRWWNPAVEDQAINRAHRIGCKSQVIVSKFICKDTIEERIDRVLNEKREMFRRVLGEGDNTNASLSLNAGEIFGLFNMKARTPKGNKSIRPEAPKKDAA